ncbi:lectin-like protein [Calothrix sp. FACHB-168]|uniref:lectin-like protein n=1 Tax=Calothrix sp. FACHB-168 TaxID=2692780 RepID=UPI001683CF67|nr:lectin-like protein [Calothrix sp. FACHB-168]MBD2201903.1 hypothetical protein [Calothrix sp. FACHB-168]
MPDFTTKQLFTFGDSIYFLSAPGAWSVVQAEALSFGGNLVTINDAKEQTFLAGLFAIQEPWIGLSDASQEGIFTWVGEQSAYQNWLPNLPAIDHIRDFAYLTNTGWNHDVQHANRQGIIEIKNPATPILVIEDLGIIEPTSGTKQAQFKVKVFGSSSQPITVNYATAPNTALAGTSYIHTSGTLTFNPGEKEKLINVTIRNDGEAISGKQFFVNLSSATNAVLADNQATGTITEFSNVFTFGGRTYLLSKAGSWGQAQVEAQSFGGNLVTINDAKEQTFLAGLFAIQEPWIGLADAGKEETFTWFDEQSAYQNWLPNLPSADHIRDFVYLTNTGWNHDVQHATRKGIIEIPTALSVPIPDMTAKTIYTFGNSIYLLSSAGSWGQAQVEAQSFQGNLVTINDAKEQTFLAGLFAIQEPWIGLSDAGKEGIFTWFGEQSAYQNWLPNLPSADHIRDFAYLTNTGWNHDVQHANRQGIIEIKNPATPILVIEDLGIIEPASGTKQAQFKVKVFGSSSQPITVNYATAPNTALAGTSYIHTSGTLTFNPGEQEKLINVTIRNDGEAISGKQFFVSLSSATNAILADNQATGTITEFSNVFTFGGRTYLLSKAGSWGQAQVEAQSFGGNLVTINDAKEQTFLAGLFAIQEPWIGLADAGKEETFTWFDEQSAYQNWLPNLPSADHVRDFVYLTNTGWNHDVQHATRKGIIEIPTALSVPIPDMTAKTIYTFGNSIYLLSSPGSWGQAQVEAQSFQGNLVTINDAKEQTFLAGLFAIQEPWIGLSDAGKEGIFTWFGEQSAYQNWLPNLPSADHIRDFAYLTNTGWNHDVQHANRQGIIEIKNPTKPILVIEDLSIVEASNGTKEAVFIVRRYGNSSSTATVKYSTSNNTAIANSDYKATSGTLTFAPGQSVQTISVTILKDADTITQESFFVNLSAPTNAILGDNQAIATIYEPSDAAIFGGKTYLLSKSGSWGQAQVQAQSFGGSLVTINDAAEQTFLAGKYASQTPWIGLSDAAKEGTFTWFGEQSAYQNWLPNLPSADHIRDFVYLTSAGWNHDVQHANRKGIIEIANTVNLVGSTANDFLYGREGNDTIDGGAGNDNLIGKAGNDRLIGNAGNDNLIGNSGNDTLIGGTGNDTLAGGSGADRFTFNSRSEGIDRITDFSVVDDAIAVSAVGFGGGLILGTIAATQFVIGTAATTTSHRFIYNNTNGALFFDQDGLGGVAQVRIATLNTGLAMTHADILVI